MREGRRGFRRDDVGGTADLRGRARDRDGGCVPDGMQRGIGRDVDGA